MKKIQLVIFAIGFDSLTFDSAIQMIRSYEAEGEKETYLEYRINNMDGFGLFAVGVQIANFWIGYLPNGQESVEGVKEGFLRGMFFKLAHTSDNAMLTLTGEVEVDETR